jgi:hypothetical protein
MGIMVTNDEIIFFGNSTKRTCKYCNSVDVVCEHTLVCQKCKNGACPECDREEGI